MILGKLDHVTQRSSAYGGMANYIIISIWTNYVIYFLAQERKILRIRIAYF